MGHEKTCLMSYANNKGADQPAHPRSLISVFVVCCLDSIIYLDSIAEISRLWLASVAEQASLSLTWSETPEDTFSHGEAHKKLLFRIISFLCQLSRCFKISGQLLRLRGINQNAAVVFSAGCAVSLVFFPILPTIVIMLKRYKA